MVNPHVYISMGVLAASALHLILLIMTVYLIAFLRLNYGARFPGTGLVLIAVQTLNLTFLLQRIVGFDVFFLTVDGNYTLLFTIQGIFIILLLIYFIRLFHRAKARRYMFLTPRSIRETIDFLPGGICFSAMNGTPILINHRMNDLVYRLTGHTIMNALLTWEQLRQVNSVNGCTRLKDIRMSPDQISDTTDENMFFSMADGFIWRLRKEELKDQFPHYIQLEAVEISDLYRYSEELYENNRRLAQQHGRQKSLIENIVEINHKKEILSTKMRIHDDLGRSILATKQHLWGQAHSVNIPYLVETWANTIRNLSDFTRIDAGEEISPEIELQKAAEMIGCHIHFYGDRPTGRKTVLLFYATVREALTNAVMHANADRLYVVIKPAGHGYNVHISDNGTITVDGLTEGNGLSNLRRRLEQEGATLQIKCGDGVILIADLPAEGKSASD